MNPQCKQCGGKCCQTLLFRGVDAVSAEFMAQTRGVMVPGGVMIDSRCRHLDDAGQCAIYATRPIACRGYAVGGVECKVTQAAWPLVVGGGG